MPTVHRISRSFLKQLGASHPPRTVNEIRLQLRRDDPEYFRHHLHDDDHLPTAAEAAVVAATAAASTSALVPESEVGDDETSPSAPLNNNDFVVASRDGTASKSKQSATAQSSSRNKTKSIIRDNNNDGGVSAEKNYFAASTDRTNDLIHGLLSNNKNNNSTSTGVDTSTTIPTSRHDDKQPTLPTKKMSLRRKRKAPTSVFDSDFIWDTTTTTRPPKKKKAIRMNNDTTIEECHGAGAKDHPDFRTFAGIRWTTSKKWSVTIGYHGTNAYMGMYDTQEEALLANAIARETLHTVTETTTSENAKLLTNKKLTDGEIKANVQLAKEAVMRARIVDMGKSKSAPKSKTTTNAHPKSGCGTKKEKNAQQKSSGKHPTTTGASIPGVTKASSGNWKVRVGYHKKYISFGTHDTRKRAILVNQVARGVLEATARGMMNKLSADEIKRNVKRAKVAVAKALSDSKKDDGVVVVKKSVGTDKLTETSSIDYQGANRNSKTLGKREQTMSAPQVVARGELEEEKAATRDLKPITANEIKRRVEFTDEAGCCKVLLDKKHPRSLIDYETQQQTGSRRIIAHTAAVRVGNEPDRKMAGLELLLKYQSAESTGAPLRATFETLSPSVNFPSTIQSKPSAKGLECDAAGVLAAHSASSSSTEELMLAANIDGSLPQNHLSPSTNDVSSHKERSRYHHRHHITQNHLDISSSSNDKRVLPLKAPIPSTLEASSKNTSCAPQEHTVLNGETSNSAPQEVTVTRRFAAGCAPDANVAQESCLGSVFFQGVWNSGGVIDPGNFDATHDATARTATGFNPTGEQKHLLPHYDLPTPQRHPHPHHQAYSTRNTLQLRTQPGAYPNGSYLPASAEGANQYADFQTQRCAWRTGAEMASLHQYPVHQTSYLPQQQVREHMLQDQRADATWFSLDQLGRIHGPYGEAQMRHWFESGHLKDDLQISQTCYGPFQPLSSCFPNRSESFICSAGPSNSSETVRPHSTWFIRDRQGRVQGPYGAGQLKYWVESGHTKDDLEISQTCNGPFVPLSLYFHYHSRPFTCFVGPSHTTDTEERHELSDGINQQDFQLAERAASIAVSEFNGSLSISKEDARHKKVVGKTLLNRKEPEDEAGCDGPKLLLGHSQPQMEFELWLKERKNMWKNQYQKKCYQNPNLISKLSASTNYCKKKTPIVSGILGVYVLSSGKYKIEFGYHGKRLYIGSLTLGHAALANQIVRRKLEATRYLKLTADEITMHMKLAKEAVWKVLSELEGAYAGTLNILSESSGIQQGASGHWQVSILYKCKIHHIGSFLTQSQAALARDIVQGNLIAAEEGFALTDDEIQQNIRAAIEAAVRTVAEH